MLLYFHPQNSNLCIKYFFSILITNIVVFGIYDYLTNFEQNGCALTYMFDIPYFKKVLLKPETRAEFPRYSLYIYGEGEFKSKPTGLPILFIPGSAGSYRQARSMASVALDISNSERFEFSFYTIDFDEEFSGMSGVILQRQTQFTDACLKAIFKLYEDQRDQPDSITIIGHSMGGIIARNLFALPDFPSQSVHTIITQATPHQAPVISIDKVLSQEYDKMNDYWRANKNASLRHVTVISSGGGYRDVLVNFHLTSLHDIVDEDRSLNINTMSQPNVWRSADHQCHIWCKQVLIQTVHSLFNCIDPATKQLSRDADLRLRIFKHYFERSSGSTRYVATYPRLSSTLAAGPDVVHNITLITRYVNKRQEYLLIPAKGCDLIIINNLATANWIASCSSEQEVASCKRGENLASQVSLIPPSKFYRKVIHIEEGDIAPAYLVNVPKTVVHKYGKDSTTVYLLTEFYDKAKRCMTFSLPTLFQYLFSFSSQITIITETEKQALFYNITFPDLSHLLQSYKFKLIPLRCDGEPSIGSLIKLHIPWSGSHIYHSLRPNESVAGELSLKLVNPKPPTASHQSAQVHLYLDPQCTFTVVVSFSLIELMGQFCRFYLICLPAFLCVQLLIVMSVQLEAFSRLTIGCSGVAPTSSIRTAAAPSDVRTAKSGASMPAVTAVETEAAAAAELSERQASATAAGAAAPPSTGALVAPPVVEVPDLQTAQQMCSLQIAVVVCAYLYFYVLNNQNMKTAARLLSLPPLTDQQLMSKHNLWDPLVPVLLTVIAYCLISLGGLALNGVLCLLSMCFPSDMTPDKEAKMNSQLKLFRNIAIGVSISLNEIAGVFIVSVVLIVKICWMMKEVTSNKRLLFKIRMNFTILMALLLILSLNCHMMFMWLKQFGSICDGFDILSINDSPMGHRMVSPGLIITLCVSFILYVDYPKIDRSPFHMHYLDLAIVVSLTAALTIVYSTVNIYNITLLFTSAFILMLLPDISAVIARYR